MLYGEKHGRFIKTPLDWAACGTMANYVAHRRRGEEACAACKKANARERLSRGRCHKCDLTAQVRGLCAGHFREAYGFTVHVYKQLKRRGVADPIVMMAGKVVGPLTGLREDGDRLAV